MKASSEPIHHSDCEARLIVEHMPGFAWSADQDGKLRYLNQRFLEYTGKGIEDFDRVAGVASFGRTEVLHPDDIADTLTAASHSVATGDPYVVEHRVRRFDGTYRWFRASAVRILDPMSQEIGWYGVDIDIDDQKRTDEALRESEQRLNRLIETLPAMVWRATPDGEPDYINSRLANYTGRGLDGIGRGPEDLGRTLDDLVKLKVQNAMVHEDDLEAAAHAWGRAHETGAFDLTARLRGADASYRWFQARAEPMRDAASRIVHWYGVAVDIDDRKRAEEALRKSEQELRGIVDAIPQTIVVLDADGTGLYANQPLLDYTGLTMEQLLTPDSRGNPVLFHPDDWARLQDERRQALSRSMPFEIEWRVRRIFTRACVTGATRISYCGWVRTGDANAGLSRDLTRTAAVCGLLLIGLPPVNRAVHVAATTVLVWTQFSYDRTCAVSSKHRRVAYLKDRKEMTASMVSIADIRSWPDISFTTGTCHDAIQP